jgi:hypothetical protein
MNKFLVTLFFLLLLSFEAGAATWYVRPASGEYGAENGTSYADAWDGFADVTQSSPASSDTVYVCGDFTTADADTATVMLVINWTNSGVILDGDCSAEGEPAMATLDGGGTHDRGLDSSSAGVASPTIRNINFVGFDVHAIIGQNAASQNWTIEDIACDGSSATGTCIRNLTAGATGWVIQDSSFANCSVDCIYTANPMTLRRVTGREWSVGGVEGDFLQSSNTSCDGFVFEDVDIESSKDIKQGIVANVCSDAANVTITGGRFVKKGLSEDDLTGFVALFFDSASGTVTANRIYSAGGRKSVFVTGGVSLVVRSSVFGETLAQNVHCGTSTTACTVENNSILGGSIGVDMQAAAAGGVARNNAISSSAIGISKGASGTESYNGINSPDPCWSGGATAACAGTDVEAAPAFLGGPNPTTAEGFKLKPSSPLCGAGTPTDAKYDYEEYRFGIPPNIGAFAKCERSTFTDRTIFTNRTTYADR